MEPSGSSPDYSKKKPKIFFQTKRPSYQEPYPPQVKDASRKYIALIVESDGKDKMIETMDDPLMKNVKTLPKSRYNEVDQICLTGNSYSKEIFKYIAQIIKCTDMFESLELSDCFVRRSRNDISESLFIISDVMKCNPTLLYINISNNALGTAGARAFAPVLQNSANLQTLLVTNCGLGSLGVKEFVDRLTYCKYIEVVSFGKNRIENQGGLYFSQIIYQLKCLTAVYLFQNGMKVEATSAIIQNLDTHCQFLETLDLSDNFVYDQAIKNLVKMVERPTCKLKNLGMSDAVQTDDIGGLLNAMLKNPPLRWEKVGFNYAEMNEGNCVDLIKLIEQSPLKYIELVGTQPPKKMRQPIKKLVKEKTGQDILFDDPEDAQMELIVAFGDLKICQ